MPRNMKIVTLMHLLVLAGTPTLLFLCPNVSLLRIHCFHNILHTDKKENQIFLIYKEIQNGAVAVSYMRKGFLIYEEKRKY
jgi:hypothetical protein